MADPTIVNDATTDAVTTTNTKVLAEAPAMATANAVYAKQQANVSYQAASTLGVTKLFSTNKILDAIRAPTSS